MYQAQIRHHIDSIVVYLNKYFDLINCHMVDYFTNDHWNNLISEEIRNYVTETNIGKLIEQTFFEQTNNSFNPVEHYVNSCKSLWLENLNIGIDLPDFYRIIKSVPTEDALSVKGFMNEKKLHEVEITSNFIANLIKSSDSEGVYIVDAGDGKGYLSSRMALQHQLKVLGIDCNETNSEGATQRNRKLQRVWKGLVERENIISIGQKPERRRAKKSQSSTNKTNHTSNASENYKVVTEFISPKSNFISMIKEQFKMDNEENINICLTGLHTCGNLAPTCLKIFKDQTCIKYLCNIGCCYHLLNEEFCEDDFFVNKNISSKNKDLGFPLSNYLKESKLVLGRNARMLASQSVHRTFFNKELPDISLFYRSLLEEIIVAENPLLKNLVQVGKIKKFTNFQHYFQKCNEKLNLNLSHLSAEYLSTIEKKYHNEQNKLNLFYFLRMCMAPIIESLILLDRLLFLYEENFNKTYLIKLFNPVISPRCYAIVSVKK
ncbi:probable methyltransferase-like protein 25 [Condylostylus longicornis]|uniref:probable methyltransferase-like protein 25 n=1 Tax=Condylostylus longicornis TaxID=2530218 RepID=UPI00244E2CC3|nr:probable methyltransferase-like protein 25 [Condylostylus longicornis]